MITVCNSNQAMDNFRAVLESAYEDYYPSGLSNDLAAITLSKLEEHAQFNINEMIELACSLPQILNEDATNVTNPHIVQEKKGKGISVTVNGKEYRYVSPDRSTEDLFHSFMGMYKHANAGYKALNYLKKNALCYYCAKNPKGKELVESFSQGKTMIKWSPAATTEQTTERINDGKLNESNFYEDGSYIAADVTDYQRVCSILSAEGIPFHLCESTTHITDEPNKFQPNAKKYLMGETTQPSAIPPSNAEVGVTEKPKKNWTDPILQEAMSGNSVIRTDKTGMSYYDDFLNPKDHDYKKLAKGLKGEIKMMSPDEYIDALGKDIFHCSRERVLRGVEWNNVKEYAAKMAAGTKFNIPILDLANETQEGRHRALAAAELGVKQIPILVVTKYDPYKELKMPKSFHLWYGHTLQYTKKDGTPMEVHVGLDEAAMKAKVAEIIKSGDYKK